MRTRLVLLLMLRKLGYKGSRADKKRILFNLILISLVVAALVFAQIFVVSMSRGIADKYAILGDGHVQVHEGAGIQIPDDPSIVDVQLVAQSYALIYSPSANKMIRLKGVGPSYFNETRLAELTLGEHFNDPSSTLPKILVSTTLAKSLHVAIGDKVALMLVSQNSIRPQLCVIKNFYDSGYQELDSNLVFCDFALVDRLFNGKEDVYHELLVEQGQDKRIKNQLVEKGYLATTWDEENYAVAVNLNTSRQAVLGVMVAVAMLCGYFISELSREMVEDDKQQIAMLGLLGGRKSMIRRVYFLAVIFVTLVSIAVGSCLGILLADNLGGVLSLLAKRSIPLLSYYLLDFSVVLPVGDILLILLVLFLVSMLSVRWSLRRVMRIEPLFCIHYD
ncbi:ABC transporter permease [Sphaerochaeta sp.]|uniref:ABC transporter permease n=1 Tax=Sphaerochaeta sp. TaxID=1972642 RepID=UPI002FCB5292